MSFHVIYRQVRDSVQQRLAKYGKNTTFTDQDSLIASGLLDSLAIIYLIMFLE